MKRLNKKPTEELTIGETIENLEFMLGQLEWVAKTSEIIAYIGNNYKNHVEHLNRKRQYKTAEMYSDKWSEFVSKRVN